MVCLHRALFDPRIRLEGRDCHGVRFANDRRGLRLTGLAGQAIRRALRRLHTHRRLVLVFRSAVLHNFLAIRGFSGVGFAGFRLGDGYQSQRTGLCPIAVLYHPDFLTSALQSVEQLIQLADIRPRKILRPPFRTAVPQNGSYLLDEGPTLGAAFKSLKQGVDQLRKGLEVSDFFMLQAPTGLVALDPIGIFTVFAGFIRPCCEQLLFIAARKRRDLADPGPSPARGLGGGAVTANDASPFTLRNQGHGPLRAGQEPSSHGERRLPSCGIGRDERPFDERLIDDGSPNAAQQTDQQRDLIREMRLGIEPGHTPHDPPHELVEHGHGPPQRMSGRVRFDEMIQCLAAPAMRLASQDAALPHMGQDLPTEFLVESRLAGIEMLHRLEPELEPLRLISPVILQRIRVKQAPLAIRIAELPERQTLEERRRAGGPSIQVLIAVFLDSPQREQDMGAMRQQEVGFLGKSVLPASDLVVQEHVVPGGLGRAEVLDHLVYSLCRFCPDHIDPLYNHPYVSCRRLRLLHSSFDTNGESLWPQLLYLRFQPPPNPKIRRCTYDNPGWFLLVDTTYGTS